MKRILTAILLSLTLIGSANAQHYGHRGYGHHHGGGHGYGWVAPLVIGGAIVYGATRQAPPPVQQVIIQPSQSPVQCPMGTAAFFNRVLVQDVNGYYTESYQFAGCR